MQIPKNLPISLHFTPSKISHALIFSLFLLLLLSLFFSFSSSSLSTTLPSFSASNLSSRFVSTSSSTDSLNTQFVSNGSAALSAIQKPHLQDSREPLNSEVNDLNSCDIFNGNWVLEDSDPIYKPGSCPFIDESFNCFKNGRPDSDYLKLRWKPYGCEIPRFDGNRMLEILRGKRVVFVGDSLNRNMWESLVCALRETLVNKSGVFEVSGRREFKTQGSYSFIFREHNCTIDFFKSPFLVQEWKAMACGGGTQEERETLRLDMIQGSSSKYYDADIIIFNTGHWWTHQKTTKG
ncbi:PC-Esterase [Dillenia turbinata]|uniref:PC-Esterase n=1 Tax=Dillenia turbinata TaxID=194707 RepID=A0AAN8ZDY7_9MAGN